MPPLPRTFGPFGGTRRQATVTGLPSPVNVMRAVIVARDPLVNTVSQNKINKYRRECRCETCVFNVDFERSRQQRSSLNESSYPFRTSATPLKRSTVEDSSSPRDMAGNRSNRIPALAAAAARAVGKTQAAKGCLMWIDQQEVQEQQQVLRALLFPFWACRLPTKIDAPALILADR